MQEGQVQSLVREVWFHMLWCGQKKSKSKYKNKPGDLPSGPVVKNPRSNVGGMGWIPDQGTKIPHAVGQLSLQYHNQDLMHPNTEVNK